MHAAALPRPRTSLHLPLSHGARVQLGVFALAYLLYSAARWLTTGELAAAQANADWILDVEHSVGAAVEPAVQDALTGTWALWLLNHLYLAAQLVVLPGALVFLYRRAPQIYRRLRNTVLATWVLSLPVYALFPVAPPRLAEVGLVDTISSQTGFALDSSLTTSFYNELAAVPSLHVGFAAAIGVALAAATRRPALKALALAWGPVVGLAVVATGNHFVFDIAAGIAAGLVGYVLGVVVPRALARGGAGRPAPLRRLVA